MSKSLIVPENLNPNKITLNLIEEFISSYDIYEVQNETSLVLNYDRKSESYYLTCHLFGDSIVSDADLNASIDMDEGNTYKLNRDIHEDKSAFFHMKKDASGGRAFEDIVFEYDPTYHEEIPLKVYGGQHRVEAIRSASLEDVNEVHGVRVYFGLSQDQKVEIALVNNTSIAVSKDLLDRMSEHQAGPELREWCQKVGLLEQGMDFKDTRDATYPTVRIARTLVVNYFNGQNGNADEINDVKLAKAGGMDSDYEKIRESIDWKNSDFISMGKAFSLLHKKQMDSIKSSTKSMPAEFARKALSLSIVASWAFAAGLFAKNKNELKFLYSLPDYGGMNTDPLNAVALSKARLKGIDPDNYRGLGTRVSPTEIGRMLEVFIIIATKQKKKITLEIANAAISSFQLKKQTSDTKQKMAKI